MKKGKLEDLSTLPNVVAASLGSVWIDEIESAIVDEDKIDPLRALEVVLDAVLWSGARLQLFRCGFLQIDFYESNLYGACFLGSKELEWPNKIIVVEDSEFDGILDQRATFTNALVWMLLWRQLNIASIEVYTRRNLPRFHQVLSSDDLTFQHMKDGRPLPVFPARKVKNSVERFNYLHKTHGNEFLDFCNKAINANQFFSQHRFGFSLIAFWKMIEKEVNTLWEENIKTKGLPKKRRENLLKGLDYTASMKIELLSLLGKISDSTYMHLGAARRARNDWVHKGIEPDLIAVGSAIQALSALVHDDFRQHCTGSGAGGYGFGGQKLSKNHAALARLRDFIGDENARY